ncbi:MAG: hypothetical protein HY060_14505 [Proteobacteria bacterium]|nr:hypothetical protein [Pseudomonadota bacterium]
MLPGQALKRLGKKTKRGFRGYPLGTIAFYGPDDKRATKVAVGIIPGEDQEAELRRWLVEQGDVRRNDAVLAEVVAYLDEAGVKSVAMVDGVFGCPHEEGVDYEGETCPLCPFWAGRDRFAGTKPRGRS